MVLHKRIRSRIDEKLIECGFIKNPNETYIKFLGIKSIGTKMKIDMRANNIKIFKNGSRVMSISVKSLDDNEELEKKFMNYIEKHR